MKKLNKKIISMDDNFHPASLNPLAFPIKDFGTVNVTYVITNRTANLLTLTLETPLKKSLPFTSEFVINGLQLKYSSRRLQAFLLSPQQEIFCKLCLAEKPLQVELTVRTIGLTRNKHGINYILELSKEVIINNQHINYIYVDDNGVVVGMKSKESGFVSYK